MAVDFRTDSGRLSVYTTSGEGGVFIREFNVEHYAKVVNDYITIINMDDETVIYKVNDINNITLDGVSLLPIDAQLTLNTILATLSGGGGGGSPITGFNLEATQQLVNNNLTSVNSKLLPIEKYYAPVFNSYRATVAVTLANNNLFMVGNKSGTLYNNTNANIYVNFGGIASSSAYVVILNPLDYYEIPTCFIGMTCQIVGTLASHTGTLALSNQYSV